jgi:hypothetical protein
MAAGERDTKTELEHEALRIYGRMRMEKAGKMTEALFRRRRKDVEKGEKTGFMPRVKEILKREGIEKAWYTDDFEREYGKVWKAVVKKRMARRQVEREKEWWKMLGRRSGDKEMEERGLSHGDARRIREGGTWKDAVQTT